MTDEIICRLLDTSSFKLKINENLPIYSMLENFFSCYSVEFATWEPVVKKTPEIIELSFSVNCKFQDVYLIAHMLKEFGLERVYPSRKQEPEINIGTYLHQVLFLGKYAMAEPLDIDSFLLIDPKLSTQNAINSAFKNQFTDENMEDDEELSFHSSRNYSDYDDDDDCDNSRYSKYGGYNGYDDDTIDSAFEGDPMATWNVD